MMHLEETHFYRHGQRKPQKKTKFTARLILGES